VQVIRWHLSGQDAEGQPFVAGVYPLRLDETCFVLAVDFDKAGWENDAIAFMGACQRGRESPALCPRDSAVRDHAKLMLFVRPVSPAR
jgi:hypothetical protein